MLRQSRNLPAEGDLAPSTEDLFGRVLPGDMPRQSSRVRKDRSCPNLWQGVKKGISGENEHFSEGGHVVSTSMLYRRLLDVASRALEMRKTMGADDPFGLMI